MRNYDRVLTEFGEYVVQRAQLELSVKKRRDYTTTKVVANRVASGTLKKSLAFNLKTRDQQGRFTDRQLKFFVLPPADDYAFDVHEGVLPGRSWESMFVPIAKWIKTKPVKLRDQEGRFIPMDRINVARAARKFAKAIERRGIGEEPFFLLAIDAAIPKFKARLTQAAKEDITIELKNTLWR